MLAELQACRRMAIHVGVLPKFGRAEAVARTLTVLRGLRMKPTPNEPQITLFASIPAFGPFPNGPCGSMLKDSREPATSMGGRHEGMGRGPHHPGGHKG